MNCSCDSAFQCCEIVLFFYVVDAVAMHVVWFIRFLVCLLAIHSKPYLAARVRRTES